ncbi:MAG: type II toxin-antitoxin system HicA family toxin [Fimbriimonas ginsengisoli]|uniref:Type II toxin-antitoxin system HicA family toxin n=1 Tax=Fimbriimonas ginsengisoli TaxID=1005039 RepID=A0A931LSE1_FIMGI|nr:type II toxin-antitoxin system HicA family toxin [Fimbriimonas ginsengisoli]
MKVRDVIRRLEADGWVHVRTSGSHRHFKHRSKPGLVTVPGHTSHEMAPGTLKSIWKQAGLEDEKR